MSVLASAVRSTDARPENHIPHRRNCTSILWRIVKVRRAAPPSRVPRQPATSPRSSRHYPGLVADESPAAVAQDRRAADPARSVLHAAARRKLLDEVSLSSHPHAHRAAGVASDMIGQMVPQRVESTSAGVSPRAVFTRDFASTEARSGRGRHENGPNHDLRGATIDAETILGQVQRAGTLDGDGPNRKSRVIPPRLVA